MVGSKDLPPSTVPFSTVFLHNQFCEKPQWPAPGTSLAGQTAIVTGCNTGLGFEAAMQLLELGLSRLVLAVRSTERGNAAADKMRLAHPRGQAFARRVEIQLPRIDIVILNAGLIKLAFATVESTGHEEQLQVNYLSTMFLAILLLPILKDKRPLGGAPSHLTIVNAALALAAKNQYKGCNPLIPAFDDPKLWLREETYNASKQLAHMFLWHLVDYVSADDVIVNLSDPAWCKGTDLTRDVEGAGMKLAVKAFGGLTGRPPRVGASCFVDAVVNKGKESHGCFLMSWKIHPFAAFLYTPEGKVVSRRVWEETLAEFEFAGVRQIVESMRA
ncbi:NAD(P)-binding protein [Mycena sanguinolenta]|uniref:NAD(P)-binding protein n=1 Tax=Mycena sanguinolenta TaxID=230812 RepID=A0A8H6YZP2_9AGAR|nr:NAD(P)-binding protein [Mycena sanguinolenta]